MGKKTVWLAAVLTVVAAVILSCSGGGSGATDNTTGACGTPIALTSGTWCVTIQSSQNTCNQPPDTTPYPATFTQNGNDLSALSFGFTYAGTICGNTASMTGNNTGITTTMKITFQDGSHAGGTVDWNTGSCSGTDTFIAVAGTCGG